jgi:hypothetical protein
LYSLYFDKYSEVVVLRSLPAQCGHRVRVGIDFGGDTSGGRALRKQVHEEMEARLPYPLLLLQWRRVLTENRS